MTFRENVMAILHYEKYDCFPVVAFGYWKETLEKWALEGHITMEVVVADDAEIIPIAKNTGDSILHSSAQSLGNIKGNLSSMQMVVKNIENELKSARDSLSTERLFPKED